MEKLFDDTPYFQKDRPTQLSTQQEEKFFLDMAKECIECQYSSDNENIISADLQNLESDDDAFTKAENLKSNGVASYNFIGAFIDWLDDLEYNRKAILMENVRLWVKAHNPQPKLKEGNLLKIIKSLGGQIELKTDSEIYIIGIDTDQAGYIISPFLKGDGGYIIPFEEIELSCQIIPQNPNNNNHE